MIVFGGNRIRPRPAVSSGGDLPEWVPSPGNIANIELGGTSSTVGSKISDQNPCPLNNCSYLNAEGQSGVFAWPGAVFNPEYGELGAYMIRGGGHNAYQGTETYAFPLDTRTWTRTIGGVLQDPLPIGSSDVPDSYGEYSGYPNIPGSSHMYWYAHYLPSTLGGGPQGSFMAVNHGTIRVVGGDTYGSSHKLDCDTGQWSRMTNDLTPISSSARPSIFDATRGEYWMFAPAGAGTAYKMTPNPPSSTWSTHTVGGLVNFSPFEGIVCWCESLDCVVYLDVTGSGANLYEFALYGLQLSDLTTGWVTLTQDLTGFEDSALDYNGTPFAAKGIQPAASADWCGGPINKIAIYESGNADYIRWLVPPASWGGTWTWQTEHFGGHSPDCREDYGSGRQRDTFRRMLWASSIKSLLWVDWYQGHMQAWRPAAAV